MYKDVHKNIYGSEKLANTPYIQYNKVLCICIIELWQPVKNHVFKRNTYGHQKILPCNQILSKTNVTRLGI